MKRLYLFVFIIGFLGFFQHLLPAQNANLTRVGEWGTGAYTDISIKGNYAFCVASGCGLEVIDTSNRSQPVLIGNINISSRAVDVSGNYAYLASGGLVIVDISDPTRPVRIGHYQSTGVYDVQVKNNFAYLASYPGGLQIIDVSSPSSPFLVGQWDNSGYYPELCVKGNKAYMQGEFGGVIIDITDPSSPALVGSFGVNGYPSGVHVSGNYAYVTAYLDWGQNYADLYILDVSNPASVVLTDNFGLGAGIGGEVYVSGNHAYCAGGNGLYIFDVSNPSTPTQVKGYETPGPYGPSGVVVEGQYCFVADGDGGLHILDVSTPSNSSLVGTLDRSANIRDVTGKDNYAYAGGTEGILIFDVSAPSSPRILSTYDVGGKLEEIFINGNYAYVFPYKGLYHPDPDGPLSIIDISDPNSPSLAGTYGDYIEIYDIFFSGNYAYVSSYYYSLEILDVSKPSQITRVGSYNSTNGLTAIWVKDNYAYVNSRVGVEVIDVSDPTAPNRVGGIDLEERPRYICINDDYAYAAGFEFYVLDISTPSSPLLVGTYDLEDFSPTFPPQVQGNYVYLSGNPGLLVLNVSNPALPGPAASYDLDSYFNHGFYVDGNYVYLAGNSGRFQVLYLEENTTSPVIHLDRSQLLFAGDTSGSVSDSQNIYVDNSGGGILEWEVSDSQTWINCSPISGINQGAVLVSAASRGLAAGTYTGSVTFTSPNAGNSPQVVKVNLTVHQVNQTSVPFGSFDTPTHGAVVSSSVPFTGWALDDVGVQKVQLFREEQDSLVYIGDAVFVEGARPDVEQAYPGYPNNQKAGWGYMMLTNFLPGQGNGMFNIHAIAIDAEGNQVTLGTKTIIADNANAVKPFGAIDTPTQGGAASGGSYVNFGWVLTPFPNTIPTDGATIKVWVDGVSPGHPVYNNYREDIAILFPGYNNSNGAAGYFYLDTTQYTNGVHTIQWTAADDAGNTDGIGSRYFNIQNSGFRQQVTNQGIKTTLRNPPELSNCKKDYTPVTCRKGYNENPQSQIIYPGNDGVIAVEIKELERVELRLHMNITTAYQVVGQQHRTLPWGSLLDKEKGIFYWQPGHGYLGRYRLVFSETDDFGNQNRKDIEIIICPKF